MDQKDKLLLSEYICAFLLVVFVIALYGGALSGYNLFLIAALVSGFTFSWWRRENPGLWPKIFVTLGTIGIFGWMVYSVINSSLYYKDVILLCIKAALLLEAVVSFNASNTSLLTQQEALTIPLCMGFALFLPKYSLAVFIFIGGYFLSWLVLLRVKFYARFKSQGKSPLVNNQANLFAATIFLIGSLSAWGMYSVIPLEALKLHGIFQEKSKRGINISPDLLEKDYYGLQEKITKMIVDRHIPGLTTSEDRHDALKFLESLIRELPDTFEVDQAEQGLTTQFKIPGPGAEKDAGENTTLLNKYVEAKSEVNLNRLKSDVLDVFKNNPLDIKGRLSALNETNKMQSASSFEDVRKNKERLAKTINKSSLEQNLKNQASALSRQMSCQKKEELKDKINVLKERNWRDELSRILAAIEKMHTLKEFDQTKNSIRGLKPEAPKDIKVILGGLEEILYVKLAMLPLSVSKDLKTTAQKQNLAGERLMAFEANVDALVDAQIPRELGESYRPLQERARFDKMNVFEANKELAGLKTEVLIKEREDKIKDVLGGNTPPDLKDNFIKELDGVKDNEQKAQIVPSFQYLNGCAQQFIDSGFVNTKNQEEIKGAMNDLEQLYIFRLELRDEVEPQEQNPPPEKEEQQKQSEPEEQVKPEKRLLSIKVLPEILRVALGQVRQFVAIGTYSDNSQEELTAKAVWTCSDEKVAKVSSGNASTLNIGTVKITAESENVVSEPATLVVREAELMAIVIPFEKIKLPLWGEFTLKAEGYYTDYSHKDITSLVSWSVVPKTIARLQGAKLSGIKLGQAKISAEYKQIKSPEVGISVILTLWVLLVLVFFAALCLILTIAFALFVFFVLMRRREKNILVCCRDNPNKAVFLIYNNAVEVLSLFEPKSKSYSAPLFFAQSIVVKFDIKDGVFIKLSAKYAEAKYSRHSLSIADAQEAVRQHNLFLSQVSGRQGFLKLSLKKALSLFKKRPFFIHL
ncbi:MAG: Ig-like domain-containing protein [Candidatus Omnitrophica bacterium]|nr:Ig-like domain-containing protein [Candidatus Omnitrophota bacterium]